MDAWCEERAWKMLQRLERIAGCMLCVLSLLRAVCWAAWTGSVCCRRCSSQVEDRLDADVHWRALLPHLQPHTQHRQTHRMSVVSQWNTLEHASIHAADLWWHPQQLWRRRPVLPPRRLRTRPPSPHQCRAHPVAWWLTCQARGTAGAVCAGPEDRAGERRCAWPRPCEKGL